MGDGGIDATGEPPRAACAWCWCGPQTTGWGELFLLCPMLCKVLVLLRNFPRGGAMPPTPPSKFMTCTEPRPPDIVIGGATDPLLAGGFEGVDGPARDSTKASLPAMFAFFCSRFRWMCRRKKTPPTQKKIMAIRMTMTITSHRQCDSIQVGLFVLFFTPFPAPAAAVFVGIPVVGAVVSVPVGAGATTGPLQRAM